MKKGLIVAFIIPVLITTVIITCIYYGINQTYYQEPTYTSLSKEEKLAISYHNEHFWAVAHDDGNIVSVQKHYKDCYHILIETESGYIECCDNSVCQSSFKNGTLSFYSPIYENKYSDGDLATINSLKQNSDPNINLNKINAARRTNYTASYVSLVELSPIMFVIFIVTFLIIGIPICISQRAKAHKTRAPIDTWES